MNEPEDTRTPAEREAADKLLAAFKRKLEQEQEAKPKNPLQATATRFPRRVL